MTQSFRTLKKFELQCESGHYVSLFYFKIQRSYMTEIEHDYFVGLFNDEEEAFDWLEQNKYIERASYSSKSTKRQRSSK